MGDHQEIVCTKDGCGRAFLSVDNLIDHIQLHHMPAPPVRPAPAPAASVAKPTRPTIDAGASPYVWEAFVVQFENYLETGQVTDTRRKITELTLAIPKPCFNRVNERYPGGAVFALSYENAIKEAKRAVVSPEATSVRRSNFLDIRQKDGESFVSFLSRARAALVDTSYRHACFHAVPPAKSCGRDGCPVEGNSYAEDQLRDILITGLADREIRKAVHAKPKILEISIRDLEEFVKIQEDALSAATGPAPAAAAASNPPPPAPPRPVSYTHLTLPTILPV